MIDCQRPDTNNFGALFFLPRFYVRPLLKLLIFMSLWIWILTAMMSFGWHGNVFFIQLAFIFHRCDGRWICSVTNTLIKETHAQSLSSYYLLLHGNQSSGDMISSFVKSICTPAGHAHLHVYLWDARFKENYANCTLSLHLRVLGIVVPGAVRFRIWSCLRGRNVLWRAFRQIYPNWLPLWLNLACSDFPVTASYRVIVEVFLSKLACMRPWSWGGDLDYMNRS